MPGLPASQGSKTAYGRVVKGKDGKLKAIVNMVEQDKGLGEWRLAVAQMGRLMKPNDWQTDGMFLLSAVFCMPRPKAHFLKSGALRHDAPLLHTARKDCDKLLRAIGDALTEVCYDDDCLIVCDTGIKIYATVEQGPGAWISVRRLDEARAEAAVRAFIG